jgi:TldD protein
LEKSKADYTEIRFESKDTTRIEFRGKKLEAAETAKETGSIVRALVRDGGWGVSTFNSLEDLDKRVEQAYRFARKVKGEEIRLAPADPVVAVVPLQLEKDFRKVSLATKKRTLRQYNDLMLGYSDKITGTWGVYQDIFSQVTYANSEGSYIEENRPIIELILVAYAKDGRNVQQAREDFSVAKGFEAVENCSEMARRAAQKAIDLLSAKPVESGRYPVILDPKLAGLFVHEAFGHLSEADFVYDNPRAREMMVLGRKFGPKFLNIADDGSVPGLRGSCKYDDEGLPTRKNYLIKNGVLVGRLHSRETAAKMDEKPTGNARASSYRFVPIVRMTNTFIEAGGATLADMLKDIRLGLYAVDYTGGETTYEHFVFSPKYAFMIRDGQIAEMVRGVVLSGNVFTTLHSIDLIGSDFNWEESASWCYKGQAGLAVASGSPHIRIQDVLVGG